MKFSRGHFEDMSTAAKDHLAPVPHDQRNWNMLSFVSIWVAALCTPPTFIFGSSLLVLGNSFGAIIFIMITASAILLPLVTANAVPGTRYGVSFPVYCRASFGHKGNTCIRSCHHVCSRLYIPYAYLCTNLPKILNPKS